MHEAVRIQVATLEQPCGEQGQTRGGLGSAGAGGLTPQLGSAWRGAPGKAGATSDTGPFTLHGSHCVASTAKFFGALCLGRLAQNGYMTPS